MTTTIATPALRPIRFDGERRYALALQPRIGVAGESVLDDVRTAVAHAEKEGAALAYGFVDERCADTVFDTLGFTSLGPLPVLVRALRLSAAADGLGLPSAARAMLAKTPLLLPFGGRRRTGVREITTHDPRVTRLWDRFSIDVGIAVERSAGWIGTRVFDHLDDGYRVFIFEDGDRYVIRALCIFRIGPTAGEVTELLHDRSVAGMRAASHLLALALRQMSDAGVESAVAWSLTHSGSFPIFVRHAFLPAPGKARLRFGVRALDPALEGVVSRREHWYLSRLDASGE